VSIRPDQRPRLLAMAAESNVPVSQLGVTSTAPQLTVRTGPKQTATQIALSTLRSAHEGFFPDLMNG
jgi:hypothetical protein